MQTIWQADFYRRPLKDDQGKSLWELLLCDDQGWRYQAICAQSEANSSWLAAQIQQAAQELGGESLPMGLQVFRPQSLSLLTAAGQVLGIEVMPTRRTLQLKSWLQELAIAYPRLSNYSGEPYEPVTVEQLPPVPMPENLWGEQWRFVSLRAGELMQRFGDRPLPVRSIPDYLQILDLGLASTVAIPGIIIDGGRKSMQLARWLESIQPVSLHYIPGQPDGLILQAGLCDRWVILTFEDAEVTQAAQNFAVRQQLAKGIHFILIQPDNSGMTYTGFWLLQSA
jgi:hypothetical protein